MRFYLKNILTVNCFRLKSVLKGIHDGFKQRSGTLQAHNELIGQ